MSPILTRMIGAGSAGSGFGFGRRRNVGGGGPAAFSLIVTDNEWCTHLRSLDYVFINTDFDIVSTIGIGFLFAK